jgi:hypothetical protein
MANYEHGDYVALGVELTLDDGTVLPQGTIGKVTSLMFGGCFIHIGTHETGITQAVVENEQIMLMWKHDDLGYKIPHITSETFEVDEAVLFYDKDGLERHGTIQEIAEYRKGMRTYTIMWDGGFCRREMGGVRKAITTTSIGGVGNVN